MKESKRPLHIKRLSDELDKEDYQLMSSANRLSIMWQITLDAWAFKGEPVTDHRLPKHIVNIKRLSD